MSLNWINKIYCKDCLEGMAEILPEKSIDVIVTSPPYNIGIEYNYYNDNIPFSDYLEWIGLIAKECLRVLKDDGSFFFNIGDRPSDELRSNIIAKKIMDYFKLQNTIHWVKSIAIPEKGIAIGHYKPINSNRFLNNAHEYIFHFTKTGEVELDKLAIGIPYADKSNIGRWKNTKNDIRDRGNQWYIPYETVKEEKKHPAMFPIELPKMCIKLHGLKKNNPLIVLDPFIGCGSTAIAAKNLGCYFVGFEIDEKYYKIALKALKN